MRPILAGLPLAALAAATLASCGETKIGANRAETLIRRAATTQIGARVASVACPDGQRARAGARFNCVVTGSDGSKGNAVVRMKDEHGTIDVEVPFLHVREVERVMARQISRRTKIDVTVACQEIVVVRKDERFTCKATTAAGRTRSLTVRLTDNAGRFRYIPPKLK